MVDAIVSLAVERISDLLIQEADFLTRVRPEVIRLKDELTRMQCFLKDADSKQDQNARVRNLISEIRIVAYRSEDVIDTFILSAAMSRGEGACGLINKLSTIFTKLPDLHQIGNQIESIRTKLGDISANMQTFNIQFDAGRDESNPSREMQHRLRRSYPHDVEEHVITFDAITRNLKAQLMMKEEQLRVISIVGMGGLGKTTLAKKLYNDIDVKQHFDCHSWAFISQQFSQRDVLMGILMNVASTQDKPKLERMELELVRGPLQKNMKEEEPVHRSLQKKMKEEELVHRPLLEKMKEEELVTTLHDVLKEKRYLIVLDDIWNIEAWDSLKPAFPHGKEGSKVLFTTRHRDVASYADPWITPVEPPLLNEDEGWELLCKKAFPRDGVILALEYEKLGRKMVKECGGLPLAVALIGGLLATKQSVNDWKAVQRNISTQLAKLGQNQQNKGVYGILALSYHSLPFHLKPCFLYLSQFPEEWEIKKKTLIRMWIAEGFISASTQEEGDETMEDRAEEYLQELVTRCLIQVSQSDHTGTGVKCCRMHDLVREMCISKSKEENFLLVEHRDYEAAVATETFSRRVAIHPRASRHNQSKLSSCMSWLERGDFQLRALFYFVESNRYEMSEQEGISIFEKFRLLRVLNIEKVELRNGYLPRELGNLIHLRYLGLRYTGLFQRDYLCYRLPVLPLSISKLKSLYTLDLRNNRSGIRLPDVVRKLECLRHLLIDRDVEGIHRLDSLRNLETLKHVKAKNLIRKDAVSQMTNLRNLAVYFQTKKEVEVVLKSPFALGRLRSLNIEISSRSSFPNLEALSGCQDLTKAVLIGTISEDVASLSLNFLPASLTKLCLCHSHLTQDPMIILEKLDNMRFLSLEDDAFKGSEIVCSVNGFRRLEILRLQSLEVEDWRIEAGAMPSLKTLYLRSLQKLRMIPEGLKFVTTLKQLKLISMEDKFTDRVKVIDGVKGEDFDKVHHIPSISFSEG